jgi:hypothetical protein
MKNQILKVSKEKLGTKSKKQPDRFEENIGTITPLCIDAKNAAIRPLSPEILAVQVPGVNIACNESINIACNAKFDV